MRFPAGRARTPPAFHLAPRFCQALLFLLALLILVTGCGQLGGNLLPTYAVLAVAPEISRTPYAVAAEVPATYTAGPAAPIQAGLATSEVTPTSSPPPTALLPTATPELIALSRPQPEGAPYLDKPPVTVPCEEGLVFRSRFPSEVAGPWREAPGG